MIPPRPCRYCGAKRWHAVGCTRPVRQDVAPVAVAEAEPPAPIPAPAEERPAEALCYHCDRFPMRRPRGLCWGCYYKLAVRERYPPARDCGRKGLGSGPSRLPVKEPTTALPGTIEKLQVLMRRAAAGQELFHPDDPLMPNGGLA